MTVLVLGVALIIVALVSGAVYIEDSAHHQSHEAHQISKQAAQLTKDQQQLNSDAALIYQDQKGRVQDQRNGCMRTSMTTAADVNLNWVYFQTEQELGQVLGQLNPRIVQILNQRAVADLKAVRVKVTHVDYHDVKLVTNKTLIYNGVPIDPRQLVQQSHFSCDAVYPLPKPISSASGGGHGSH